MWTLKCRKWKFSIALPGKTYLVTARIYLKLTQPENIFIVIGNIPLDHQKKIR